MTELEVAQERAELLATLVESWFAEWRAGRLAPAPSVGEVGRRSIWQLAKDTKALLDGRG